VSYAEILRASDRVRDYFTHRDDQARRHTEAALHALLAVMERGKSESARVAAAHEILDRGWGRARQEIDFDGHDGPVVPVSVIMVAAQRVAAQLGRDGDGHHPGPAPAVPDPLERLVNEQSANTVAPNTRMDSGDDGRPRETEATAPRVPAIILPPPAEPRRPIWPRG
jgi:hypothetical protein